jgi:FAD synthetase
MKEDARERSVKYMETTAKSLKQLKKKELPTAVNQKQVDHVLELVEGYMKDAKHYVADKPITSLACVAYAEGLLDALKFLELMEE